jgi:hypothetical protein
MFTRMSSEARAGKRGVQHHENHRQRDGQHHRQPRRGALLVFKLAAPDDAIALRQLDMRGDVGLGIGHIAHQIAPPQGLHQAKREPFSCSSLTGPAMRCTRATSLAHQLAAGAAIGLVGKALRGLLAVSARAADQDRHAAQAIGHHARAHAFHLRAHGVLQLVDRHARAARGDAVDVDLEIIHLVGGHGQRLAGAGDRLQPRLDLPAMRASSALSGPNTLIARSPRAPVSISETRISMGWV